MRLLIAALLLSLAAASAQEGDPIPVDAAALKPVLDKIKVKDFPNFGGSGIALRYDQKPFDDIRVRRAMNMAVDKQAILKSYYGGAAALVHMPMSSGWADYYTPLDKMPPAVRELYEFNPAKAKELMMFSTLLTADAALELGLLHRVFAVVEDAGGQHRISATGLDTVGQVL